MRILALLIGWLFLLFFSASSIRSAVYVNEFVPNSQTEWIELFNSSTSAEYLKTYFIDDDTDFLSDSGSGPKKSLNTLDIINTNYPFFETSSFLNNQGDYVVVFSSDGSIIDQYQFSSDPGGGVSIGRSPDGSGNFFVLSGTTKGAANSGYITPTPSEVNPSLTETPTPSQTPTQTLAPTPAKSIYKINKPKDQNGQLISSVKIYVDNQYTHHEDDEILEFCDGCFCDDAKTIQCGYGEHTIKLTKTEYSDWSELRNFIQGASHEITPILTKTYSEPTTTSTPTPTSSPTPRSTPVLSPDAQSEPLLPETEVKPSESPTMTPPEVTQILGSSDSAILSASISAESNFSSTNDETNDSYLKPIGVLTFAGILFSAAFWRFRVLTRPIG